MILTPSKEFITLPLVTLLCLYAPSITGTNRFEYNEVLSQNLDTFRPQEVERSAAEKKEAREAFLEFPDGPIAGISLSRITMFDSTEDEPMGVEAYFEYNPPLNRDQRLQYVFVWSDQNSRTMGNIENLRWKDMNIGPGQKRTLKGNAGSLAAKSFKIHIRVKPL